MTRAARLWLMVFGLGFAGVVALLLATAFTQPAYGDFTRVGRISEHAFGWRSTPPPIAAQFIKSVPLDKADVLVVGDSFSVNYFAWQASLVEAGYGVSTTHWDKIGPLCDDFGSWLRQSGFRGRLVIIESIERLLSVRLQAARECRAMRQSFSAYEAPGVSPVKPVPAPQLNWKSPLQTGLVTYLNTRAIEKSTGYHVVNVPAVHREFIFSHPLAKGCVYFSNRMCDKGLFLADDRHMPELTAADADFMAGFAARAQPLQIMWMVIPDKSTVYLDTSHGQAFVERANAWALGPDLFARAHAMREQMVDLYWSNDTHWSMQGQKYFGGQMLSAVRATIGPPSGHPFSFPNR